MNLTVIDSGVIVRTLAPREHAVTCVAISADSKYALCGDEGGHLHYWLLDTGECLRSLSMGPKPGQRGLCGFLGGMVSTRFPAATT